MYKASLDVEFNFTSNELKLKAIKAIFNEIFTENQNFLLFQITFIYFIHLHIFSLINTTTLL